MDSVKERIHLSFFFNMECYYFASDGLAIVRVCVFHLIGNPSNDRASWVNERSVVFFDSRTHSSRTRRG